MLEEIYDLIRKLGVHATYQGYHFLAYAVFLSVQDGGFLLTVTKRLYPAVAERFHTSVKCVERNLRTVISVCWDRGNRELLNQIAGRNLSFKPTTGEFIDILAGYIQGGQKEELSRQA